MVQLILGLVLAFEWGVGLAEYLVDVRGHWVCAFKRAIIDLRLLGDDVRALCLLGIVVDHKRCWRS